MLREGLARSFRVEELAGFANMSPSSFHAHFKAVTSMSPIRYQKQIRLLEARRLLIAEATTATAVAFKVGYESVSQFNRDRRRGKFAGFERPSHDRVRMLVGQHRVSGRILREPHLRKATEKALAVGIDHGRHEIHPLHAIARDQVQCFLDVELHHARDPPATKQREVRHDEWRVMVQWAGIEQRRARRNAKRLFHRGVCHGRLMVEDYLGPSGRAAGLIGRVGRRR